MTPVKWRAHVKEVLERRTRYQFGQPKDSLVDGGAVACTDTCIQLIKLLVNGKRVSLDRVRRLSGGPTDGSRGLRADEALRALTRLGLPYVQASVDAEEVMYISKTRGPVIVAEAYWAHPEWQGSSYLGRKADGWERDARGNRVHIGYAKPLGQAGKTQTDFRAGHAVLLAWATNTTAWVRDPNHNSPARPERPAYDVLTVRQLERMLDSFTPLAGRHVLYVPSRRVF